MRLNFIGSSYTGQVPIFVPVTSASPAGRIVPASISSRARPQLTFDHLLRVVRGVKRCTQCSSSSFPFCPSIQPKHSATSSAAR